MMSNIPLVDTTRIAPGVKEEITNAIHAVIESGDFILGKKVSEFEESFAEYLGVDYGIGVASGTDALLLALAALGLKEGDEVIIPSMTFIATLTPLIFLRAQPIIVDIEPDTFQINPEQIKKALTPKTKAILPVHLYGYLADMKTIKDIAQEKNIKIVEDAAQAHGSMRDGYKAGSLGDVATFSFYPGKNLGAYGDAGAVVTNNKEIAERLKMLRNHGQQDKYHHLLFGYNSRLDTLQAAVLAVKLKYLDEQNKKRRKNAERYDQYLQNLPISRPPFPSDQNPNFHLYVIKTDRRDELHEYLKNKGVQTVMHYPVPLHLQAAAKDLGYTKGDFPVSEDLAGSCLSLPMFPGMKDEEIKYVSDEIRTFLTGR